MDKLVCAQCGSELRPGMIRCRECGQLVNSPSSKTPPPESTPLAKLPEAVTPESPAAPAESSSLQEVSTEHPEEKADTEKTLPSRSVLFTKKQQVGRKEKFYHLVKRRKFWLWGGGTLLVLGLAGWWLFRNVPPPEFQRSISTSAEHLTCLQAGTSDLPLFMGSTTGDVFLWNGEGKVTPLPKVTDDPITSLDLAHNRVLLAGVLDKKLCGWDLRNEKVPDEGHVVESLPSSVLSVASHPTQIEMVTALSGGQLQFRGVKGKRRGIYTPGHRGGVKCVAYSPTGSVLVTGGIDGRLGWYVGGSPKAELVEAHSTEVAMMLFSPDGKTLLTGDWNGNILFWDVKDRKRLRNWKQSDAVSGMVWLEGQLVTGSWDGRIRFWSEKQGVVEREISTRKPILDMALLPGTSILATISGGSEVDLWDLSPR